MRIKICTNRNIVVFNLIISAFILTMLSLGGAKLTIELILFCTLVSVVFTTAGDLVLRASHLTKVIAWLPAAFVVGFAAISLPMMALALIFNVSALTAFWISSLSVFSLSFSTSRVTTTRISRDFSDTAIALVISIIIGLLVKVPVSSPSILLNTGMLPIWSDYFLHGITIASFGSPFASGGDMELAGISRAFYHFAPFMIPATFQTVSGMSGFALSTSLLLPLGLLIAALGSYAFAVELGGRLCGLLAIAIIISLPAYSVFIQSGWFDFYWLLFIAPGSGYALGVSAVVCATTVTYLKKNDSSILGLTMLLLFSLVLIRVHLFMLLAPAIVAVILLNRWRINIRLLLGAVISVIAIVILALHFSTYLHSLWIEYANPHGYLNIVLQWSPIYGYPIKFPYYPFGLTLFAQIMVTLVSVLGVYFVLYPFMLWLSVRRFGFYAIDALPLLLILSFIGLMLFAPSSRVGDLTDYKHRHFILLYVVTAIYTITYAFTWVSNHISNEKKCSHWVYGLVACIFAASIILNWNSNPVSPNVKAMPWASSVFDQPVTPGLLEASQYLRTHAQYGDVLAMGVAAVSGLSAPIVDIVSLTGIPAYLSRSELRMKFSKCVRGVVDNRLSVLQKLSAMDNWPDAQRFLQANGIRWFLVLSGEKQKWDTNREFAVFSSNGMSVYDTGHSGSEIFKNLEC